MGSFEGISSWLHAAADYLFTKEENVKVDDDEPIIYNECTNYNSRDYNTYTVIDQDSLNETVYIEKADLSKFEDYATKMTLGLSAEKIFCQKDIKQMLTHKANLQKNLQQLLKKRHALDAERKIFPRAASKHLQTRQAAIKKEISQIDLNYHKDLYAVIKAKKYIQKQKEKVALIESLLCEVQAIEQMCKSEKVSLAQVKAKSMDFEKMLLKYSEDHLKSFDQGLQIRGLKV